jgi:hypothetical protein
VTGAPKVRAMEVIAEVEATGRETYTGAIGYVSPCAGLELNVAIRTFEFSAGRVWLGVGGGVVIDSTAEDEQHETLVKAAPLLAAIGARFAPGVSTRPVLGLFGPASSPPHGAMSTSAKVSSPPCWSWTGDRSTSTTTWPGWTSASLPVMARSCPPTPAGGSARQPPHCAVGTGCGSPWYRTGTASLR